MEPLTLENTIERILPELERQKLYNFLNSAINSGKPTICTIYGDGNNGKTVLTKLIKFTLGHDTIYLPDNFKSWRYVKAEGKKLGIIQEAESVDDISKNLRMEILNRNIGGIRHVIIVTNTPPEIKDDENMMRYVNIVCPNKFTSDSKCYNTIESRFTPKLREEILNKI